MSGEQYVENHDIRAQMPVRDFEGLYEVSNLARVRSVDRWLKGGGEMRLHKGKIRKQRFFGDGTNAYVRFFKDKKEYQMLVYRLVAEAFVPNPDHLPEVRHKDGCKTNNAASNLEWFSPHIPNEEWRPIAGWEGSYDVSNFGRVRSLDNYRRVCDVNGGEHIRFVKGAIRKLQLLPNGYVSVILKDGGRKKRFNVHRLVAKAFLPNPNNLPEVNHKDENKLNNYADNLEWCDHTYNVNYGTCRERMRKTKSKHQIEQLTLDGRHIAYFDSCSQAERMCNISRTSIIRGIRYNNNIAKGYRWRYI